MESVRIMSDEVCHNQGIFGKKVVGMRKNGVCLPSPSDRMVREVGCSLDQRCGVGEGAELVVGVSGGADSLALLAILEVLARKRHRRYGLCVVHVHHHLREEADGEAAAVEELVGKLGRRFVRKDVYPGEGYGNLSAVARELRYRALMEVACEVGAGGIDGGGIDGGGVVVTGHHGTDQLETVLFHLIRGAGLDGLAGMGWRTEIFGGVVVRPMLGRSHEDCVRMCQSIGWDWFEDGSNADCDKVRNRIRAEVLPVLREVSGDVESRIWRMTTLLREASEFVGESADGLIRQANREGGGCVLNRELLRGANSMVLGFGLREMVSLLGGSVDGVSYRVMEKVVGAIQDGSGVERRFEFGGGVVVHVGKERVCVLLSEG